MHYGLFQRIIIVVAVVSATIHVLMLVTAGALVVGRQAGQRNPLTQILYTLGKVVLYIFVPCAVITAILILIAALAGYPL